MWKLTPICLVLLSAFDLLLSELPRSFICGNVEYNDTDRLSLCCNGKLLRRTNDHGSEFGCCLVDFAGKRTGEVYVKETHLCCGAHILPKNNTQGEERLCCGDELPLAKEGFCCDETFHKHNSDADNRRTQGCCDDKVVTIPFTRGPTVCCGNRMIDLMTHQCCGKKVLHKYEKCCGGLRLSGRNVCCHRKLSGDDSQIMKRKMNDTDCCLHGDKLQLKTPYNKYDQACDIRMGVVKKAIPTLPTSTTTSTEPEEKETATEKSDELSPGSNGSSHMSFCIYTLAPITILWLLITGYLQI